MPQEQREQQPPERELLEDDRAERSVDGDLVEHVDERHT
jgi:hypothetical protein